MGKYNHHINFQEINFLEERKVCEQEYNICVVHNQVMLCFMVKFVNHCVIILMNIETQPNDAAVPTQIAASE